MGLRRTFAGASKKKLSAQLENFLVVCAGPAHFFLGNVIYKGAGTPWLQLHDKAAKPSAAAIPLMSQQLAAAGNGYIETVTGIPMDTGITLVLSSTQDTYTEIVGTDGIFLGTYH